MTGDIGVLDKKVILTEYCWHEGKKTGFYDSEYDEGGMFVWTEKRFLLMQPENFRYLYLKLGTDRECHLHVAWAGNSRELPLLQGWHLYTLDLQSEEGKMLLFTVEVDRSDIEDPRELGVMVRSIEHGSDPKRYSETVSFIENKKKNLEEFHTGKSRLESVPVKLRIAMENRCDIANSKPCVYCAWDWAKKLERGSPDFNSDFIHALGKYLTYSEEVVDCSHGEPLLKREFGMLIEHLGRNGRKVAFTSNGRLLTKKRREMLLGNNIEVNISIDSATEDGYRKFRGEGFEKIVNNLSALCEEKKAHSNLPTLITSFIVMRSTMHEIENYIDLLYQIGVDRVRFRALLIGDIYDDFVGSGENSAFRYRDEILSAEELDNVASQIEHAAGKTGTPVIIEWKAFVNNQRIDRCTPLCSEPWQCLYVLNRGITPCCYGKQPIATLEGVENGALENFLDDTWNSEVLVEIREKLVKHQLADYCKNTPSCPIVKKIKR